MTPLRTLFVLNVALFMTSCYVPPACLDRTFGFSPPKSERFASVMVYSGTKDGPLERGTAIIIDASGDMAVSTFKMWPESCPRMSRTDLDEIARHWQPLLDQTVTTRVALHVMAKRSVDGERPPLELSIGSASGKNVQLAWDGRTTLPKPLDTAVMRTLETVCSNSRLAERYLLRDLPKEVSSRLDCRG